MSSLSNDEFIANLQFSARKILKQTHQRRKERENEDNHNLKSPSSAPNVLSSIDSLLHNSNTLKQQNELKKLSRKSSMSTTKHLGNKVKTSRKLILDKLGSSPFLSSLPPSSANTIDDILLGHHPSLSTNNTIKNNYHSSSTTTTTTTTNTSTTTMNRRPSVKTNNYMYDSNIDTVQTGLSADSLRGIKDYASHVLGDRYDSNVYTKYKELVQDRKNNPQGSKPILDWTFHGIKYKYRDIQERERRYIENQLLLRASLEAADNQVHVHVPKCERHPLINQYEKMCAYLNEYSQYHTRLKLNSTIYAIDADVIKQLNEVYQRQYEKTILEERDRNKRNSIIYQTQANTMEIQKLQLLNSYSDYQNAHETLHSIDTSDKNTLEIQSSSRYISELLPIIEVLLRDVIYIRPISITSSYKSDSNSNNNSNMKNDNNNNNSSSSLGSDVSVLNADIMDRDRCDHLCYVTVSRRFHPSIVNDKNNHTISTNKDNDDKGVQDEDGTNSTWRIQINRIKDSKVRTFFLSEKTILDTYLNADVSPIGSSKHIKRVEAGVAKLLAAYELDRQQYIQHIKSDTYTFVDMKLQHLYEDGHITSRQAQDEMHMATGIANSIEKKTSEESDKNSIEQKYIIYQQLISSDHPLYMPINATVNDTENSTECTYMLTVFIIHPHITTTTPTTEDMSYQLYDNIQFLFHYHPCTVAPFESLNSIYNAYTSTTTITTTTTTNTTTLPPNSTITMMNTTICILSIHELRLLLDDYKLPLYDTTYNSHHQVLRNKDLWPYVISSLIWNTTTVSSTSIDKNVLNTTSTSHSASPRLDISFSLNASPTCKLKNSNTLLSEHVALEYAFTLLSSISIHEKTLELQSSLIPEIKTLTTSTSDINQSDISADRDDKTHDIVNVPLDDWENIDDTTTTSANLSLLSADIISHKYQVPGAFTTGSIGLGSLSDPLALYDHTQVAAHIVIHPDSEYSHVQLTMTMDAPICNPPIIVRDTTPYLPPYARSEPVSDAVPHIYPRPKAIYLSAESSRVRDRMSPSIITFNHLSILNEDITIDRLKFPPNTTPIISPYDPIYNIYGFRQYVTVPILPLNTTLLPVSYGISIEGVLPSCVVVNKRNIWKNLVPLMDAINRPRDSQDYIYMLINDTPGVPNTPNVFTIYWQATTFHHITCSGFHEKEKESREHLEYVEAFEKEILEKEKEQSVERILRARKKQLKLQIKKKIQTKLDMQLDKATTSEAGWQRRYASSYTLEYQHDWEKRYDTISGHYFYHRLVDPTQDKKCYNLQGEEKYLYTCQWEAPPIWIQSVPSADTSTVGSSMNETNELMYVATDMDPTSANQYYNTYENTGIDPSTITSTTSVIENLNPMMNSYSYPFPTTHNHHINPSIYFPDTYDQPGGALYHYQEPITTTTATTAANTAADLSDNITYETAAAAEVIDGMNTEHNTHSQNQSHSASQSHSGTSSLYSTQPSTTPATPATHILNNSDNNNSNNELIQSQSNENNSIGSSVRRSIYMDNELTARSELSAEPVITQRDTQRETQRDTQRDIMARRYSEITSTPSPPTNTMNMNMNTTQLPLQVEGTSASVATPTPTATTTTASANANTSASANIDFHELTQHILSNQDLLTVLAEKLGMIIIQEKNSPRKGNDMTTTTTTTTAATTISPSQLTPIPEESSQSDINSISMKDTAALILPLPDNTSSSAFTTTMMMTQNGDINIEKEKQEITMTNKTSSKKKPSLSINVDETDNTSQSGTITSSSSYIQDPHIMLVVDDDTTASSHHSSAIDYYNTPSNPAVTSSIGVVDDSAVSVGMGDSTAQSGVYINEDDEDAFIYDELIKSSLPHTTTTTTTTTTIGNTIGDSIYYSSALLIDQSAHDITTHSNLWKSLPKPDFENEFQIYNKICDSYDVTLNTMNESVTMLTATTLEAGIYEYAQFQYTPEIIFISNVRKELEHVIDTLHHNMKKEEILSQEINTHDLLLYGSPMLNELLNEEKSTITGTQSDSGERRSHTSESRSQAETRSLAESRRLSMSRSETGTYKTMGVPNPTTGETTITQKELDLNYYTEQAIIACKTNNIELLEQALDEGVDVETIDQYGNTLLILAAQQGSKRMCKFLMRRMANLNVQNQTGNTALHFCYAYNKESLGEYLISKGANDKIVNVDGLTCYEGLNRHQADLTPI